MFGALNYGEIPHLVNKADNDPWDVFAPGYMHRITFNKPYTIHSVIGVFMLRNGNHKIAIRVHTHGFNKIVAKREIRTYCEKYTAFTKVPGKWIAFHEDYVEL